MVLQFVNLLGVLLLPGQVRVQLFQYLKRSPFELDTHDQLLDTTQWFTDRLIGENFNQLHNLPLEELDEHILPCYFDGFD